MDDIAGIWTVSGNGFPEPADREALAARREQLAQAGSRHPDPEVGGFVEAVLDHPVTSPLLDSVLGNSPYLSHGLTCDAAFTCRLLSAGPEQAMAGILADMDDLSRLGQETRSELMVRLRIAKRQFALAAAMADIAGCRDVMSLAADLSDLACSCLQASASALLREAHDRGKLRLRQPDLPTEGSGLVLLGMGKLGAGELNFSSDIDLIVLFDDKGVDVDGGTCQQLFSRMARNLVEVMARRTADGYVFRTDLRLRPDPSSTPPAVSIDAAAAYYRTIGQTWERAAMIKARPVAGDMVAGDAFLASNSGFVWRRNLDFATIRDIQSVKRQIDAHRSNTGISVEGHNVKLGRGGIREIEFFTQTQQLIWGGQSAELHGRKTLDMLDLLAARGRIPHATATELSECYVFLRRVEHRLQMVDDQQTHTLPETPEGIAGVATFLGYADVAEFRRQLLDVLARVNRHYDDMLDRKKSGSSAFDIDYRSEQVRDRAVADFGAQGFERAADAWKIVHGWMAGEGPANRGERAVMVLEEITPRLLSAFSASSQPDATLARFDGFLAQLPRSLGLLEMLSAQPQLCDLVSEIMSSAPRLSEWLRQEPGLFESVLQSDFADLELPDDVETDGHLVDSARRGLVRVFYKLEFRPPEIGAELERIIEQEMQGGFDLQTVLDMHRRWARHRKFQIVVHMLRGHLSPAEASAPLCGIAETCLQSLVPAIRREFEQRHGRVEGGELAIIAGGRLGSREMTLASDLDLIFVYRHPDESLMSDGARPLAATQYFAKLCRRFINGVVAPTAEGVLYEVDTRLRPSGRSGPIACSIDRFEKYQRDEAWTRARIIHAEGDLADRLPEIIGDVLTASRDRGKLGRDIRDMRERVRRETGESGNSTIKLRHGGILDADFIAQYLQLAHACDHPEILLRDARSVFLKAGELNIIDPQTADQLAGDMLFWRNLQGMLLLATDDNQTDEDVIGVLGNSFGIRSKGSVASSLSSSVEETAARVSGNFSSLIPPGE